MWLLLPFVALPLVEIALFVTLGAWLGLWLSLAIVIGTALMGIALIRRQGRHVRADVAGAMRRGGDPGRVIADGGLAFVAGVLLILPGFLTDALGLLLLIPPLRRLLIARVARRMPSVRTPSRQAGQPIVIEGSFARMDDPVPPTNSPPSGWTRH